jgi:Lrp/AsnC family transcriptional regulator, leucine-responsive regulatory protein
MPKTELDAIDCRIVAALQANGRLSNIELADLVGLSPSPCSRRVKRLEQDGYIVGYRAALRRDRVGLGFSVFVGVKINGHANDLRVNRPLVIIPDARAGSRIDGPDAEQMLHGYRFENATLGVD